MQIDWETIIKKTSHYVPGWVFIWLNDYDNKRNPRKEEVKVIGTFSRHILVTNGLYQYSISRFDLYLKECGHVE